MTIKTPPASPIDLAESVAGEEDPGAGVDLSIGSAPGRPDQPMSPGDQAPVGTPGTGQTVCPRCGGSGQFAGRACPECEGTGKINVGIGGG